MDNEKQDIRKYAFIVTDLASSGISAPDIAKYLDMPLEDLKRDYSDILNTALINRTREIAQNLYRLAAVDGNLQASIYWLKCHGKWEELAKQKEDVVRDNIVEAIDINIIPSTPVIEITDVDIIPAKSELQPVDSNTLEDINSDD